MRLRLPAAAALLALSLGAPAHATTVSDPTGDFLASFTAAPPRPDLDVTSFSVNFDRPSSMFAVSASVAGPFDFSIGTDLYVIGVNTGTGANAPFGGIGEPNVIFNQALVVRKNGTVSLGANVVAPATFTSNTFSFLIPLSLLPATIPGFQPEQYGWNLWPRVALGNNNQIADFAPENATITGVPEPASWAMMIAGFGLVGGLMRRRCTVTVAA